MSDGAGTAIEINDEILSAVQEAGYVVRNTEQDEQYKKTVMDEAIRNRDREFYTKLTDTVKEKSGIDPLESEKAFDYVQRTFETFSETHSSLQKKLESYENGQVEKDETLKTFKSKNQQLADQLKQVNEQFEQFKTGIEQEKRTNKINGLIMNEMNGIKHTLKSVEGLDDIVENRLNKFKQEIKIKELDGAIVLTDQDDNPLINKVDGSNVTIGQALKGKFEDLVDTSRPVGGMGANGAGRSGEEGGVLTIPETIRDQSELLEYMERELKLDPSSEEFTEKFMATRAKYKLPIRKR